MTPQKIRSLFLLLCLILIGHGVLTFCIMSSFLAMNNIAPGKIIGYTFTFYLTGTSTIVFAAIGFIGMLKRSKVLLSAHFIGTCITAGCAFLLGIMPFVYFSWKFRDLEDLFYPRAVTGALHFYHIEEIYGCCGLTSSKDYQHTMSIACCGGYTCIGTKVYEEKPGCLENVEKYSGVMLFTGLFVYLGAVLQVITGVLCWKFAKTLDDK